ncbi:MAG: ATP-binding cassette domain-containing protein [Solirubrobacteraceae bacterium]
MTALLSIEHVSKSYRRGRREYVALRDVSLAVESGEYVVVLGSRKSGRSTLLRLAAGLERPDEGSVRFDGIDLSCSTGILGRRLCYCRTAFSAMEGGAVAEHVAAGLLAGRVSPARARRSAEGALERVGLTGYASMYPYELNGEELVRVAIARALAVEPSLIVVDDPTAHVGMLQGGPILALLRSIADEGVSVLASTDDATCLSGADRALSLDAGRLQVQALAPQAEVVPLRKPVRRTGTEPGADVG